MRHFLFAMAITAVAMAQPPVAPTPEPVGPPRGENNGGYNITNAFEFGYRFSSVGGDFGMYRSNVNYQNGLRLLSGSLTVHSREGHGALFDEIVLNTLGLGNDPYESASLRVQKNRLYRYDMLWRMNEYYNPALTISFGEHLMDTRRRLQDHDLTLFPQSSIRFLFGYSRSSQTGPALTTVQETGTRGDEFPLFADVRRVRNEYRVGAEARLLGARFTVLRGWDDFKEDTPYLLPSPSPGNNPADGTSATAISRNEPYHGTSPYWRLGLFRERKVWSLTARFNQVSGQRNFLFDELFAGTAPGLVRQRQILISGDGRRPSTNGNLTLSFFPGSLITVTNHTAFSNTRMEGDSFYSEFNNATATGNLYYFQMLGIRTITNQTDMNVRFNRWFGLFTGYHYSDRRIRSTELTGFPTGPPDTIQAEQSNQQHSGLFGLRFRPLKPLSINLDAEVSRADRPFYPISDRNYHALSGRIQYRTRGLTLAATAKTNYNTNSDSLAFHSARTRNYGADASWAARDWLSFDLGYSKLHVDTDSFLSYFANFTQVEGRSIYISNIHAANAGVRVSILKRADLFAGYTRVQDTGDGRPVRPADAFLAAQTFPLAFDSPLARLSVRITEKIRWNAGYQHYGYSEKFSGIQNYRAHTGYTSVLWSF